MQKAGVGLIVTVIIYIASFIPFIICFTMENVLSVGMKVILNLFLPSCFCTSLVYVTRFETQGSGIQWHNILKSPVEDDPFSFLHFNAIMFLTSMFTMLLGIFVLYIQSGKF